jgi:hypothetical protein
MVQDQPKQWNGCLAMAEFWYNSTFHSSLGCSPYKALYGHDPNLEAMPDLDSEKTPVTDVLAERAVQAVLLTNNLEEAQARMKYNTDKHRTEKEYQVGDKVLLKLQPYAQASVVNRPYPKLSYKYFGPYPILEHIRKAAWCRMSFMYRS